MAATYILEDRGYKTQCWIWQGTMRGGYGQKSNPKYSRNKAGVTKMIGAHVFYYEQTNGDIPAGLVLDHLCNVRACVNPEHLEAKTHAKNIRRGKQSKISEEIVKLIRAELDSGIKQTSISIKYRISQATVSQIARHITWKGISR